MHRHADPHLGKTAREVSESATQPAARWILMHDAVSTVIPRARSRDQARSNAAAADLPALDERTIEQVARVHEEQIAPHVHHRW